MARSISSGDTIVGCECKAMAALASTTSIVVIVVVKIGDVDGEPGMRKERRRLDTDMGVTLVLESDGDEKIGATAIVVGAVGVGSVGDNMIVADDVDGGSGDATLRG